MAKIHISKREVTKRKEERAARVERVKQKKQPTNADVTHLLGDIWDELQEIKEKLP